MAGFIGADRHGPRQPRQRCIGLGRQGLLDQGDAEGQQLGGESGIVRRGPALVVIDDEAGIGGVAAHRAHPVQIIGPRELQLQQRPARLGLGSRAHLFRRIEAEGIGRRHWRGLGQAGQGPDGLSGELGLQVP
jgi:hypothetical protein